MDELELAIVEDGGEDVEQDVVDVEEALAQEVAKRVLVERRLFAMEKGIPSAKAERYVRLAGTYLDEGGDFGAALDAALGDFPLQRDGGVPRVVARGASGRSEKGWKRMTLGERAELFRKDPDRARALAARDGERL